MKISVHSADRVIQIWHVRITLYNTYFIYAHILNLPVNYMLRLPNTLLLLSCASTRLNINWEHCNVITLYSPEFIDQQTTFRDKLVPCDNLQIRYVIEFEKRIIICETYKKYCSRIECNIGKMKWNENNPIKTWLNNSDYSEHIIGELLQYKTYIKTQQVKNQFPLHNSYWNFNFKLNIYEILLDFQTEYTQW